MNCGCRKPIAESLVTQYWGKAREGVAGEASWHPLAYHSLDVAAVGQALFAARPALRSLLGRLTGLPEEVAQQWFLLALAWHDLGKFSDGFQAKAPHALESIGRDMPRANDYGHSALSLDLWDKALKERAEVGQWFGSGGERAFRWFLSASAGHHGSPVKSLGFPEPQESFRQPGFDDAMAFAAASHALLCPDGATAPKANESLSRRASWLVAGLAVLCDWVGSNAEWFKHRVPNLSLEDYWRDIALPKAADAIREAGLATPAPPRPRPGADMLPLKAEPSPLQRFADTVGVSGGPQIFVMEDLTGAGKTEAALILARRLMAAGAACGPVLPFPTRVGMNRIQGYPLSVPVPVPHTRGDEPVGVS